MFTTGQSQAIGDVPPRAGLSGGLGRARYPAPPHIELEPNGRSSEVELGAALDVLPFDDYHVFRIDAPNHRPRRSDLRGILL